MKLARQYDSMDCGPACVKMIARHYGKDYSLNELRNMSYLSRDGVSVAGIREALEGIGMTSKSFLQPLDVLVEKCPLPAIIHWEQNHFVVLYKIKRNRWNGQRYFYLADPAFSKHHLREDVFCEAWLNGDKGVFIASEPTPAFYERVPKREEHTIAFFVKRYILPFRSSLLQLAVGLGAGIVISLIAPFLTQALVDNGIGQRDMHILTLILIAQIALFIGSSAINLFRNWVVLYMQTRIDIRIISDFLQKVMKLPMKFFEIKSIGDLSRRMSDYGRLESFATSSLLNTVFSMISFIVFAIVIGYYSLGILLLYMGCTVLSTLWMTMYLRKRKSIDYRLFGLSARNENIMYEMLSGMSDIKLNNFQDYKRKEWENIQEELLTASVDSLKIGQQQTTGYNILNQLRDILVTYVVAVSVIRGEITLGMMMSISYIVGQLSSPLSQLVNFIQSYQDARISVDRAGEIHIQENEDARTDYLPVPAENKDIRIEGLYFRYEGPTSPWVLKNVCLSIPKGKVTAIVGESGSGKTTLVKLLLRFYPPQEGMLLIDGHPLGEYAAEEWRKYCGIVMQNNYVFSDTIERNIALGEENIDERRLEEAIRIANLKDYMEKQPLGVKTKIGAAGCGISGGEQQRLMIARAVYKNPSYLFLDEATSSLDAENEKVIVQNLNKFFKGKSVVVIAHRLSTVKHADQIAVMKKGEVVELGTHEQLVASKGIYFNLVKNQLELAKE